MAATKGAPSAAVACTIAAVGESGGSAVLSAEVAGLLEAVRWVLSWGRNAVALDLPELRRRWRRNWRWRWQGTKQKGATLASGVEAP